MPLERLFDHGRGEDVHFPTTIAMFGDVGLRPAIAGLDLNTLAQAGAVERVNLLAGQADTDETEMRTEAGERLFPGPLNAAVRASGPRRRSGADARGLRAGKRR